MLIASVDYGLNCGIAVADIEFFRGEYHLHEVYLNTLYNALDKTNEILEKIKPFSVVLEDCPKLASNYSIFLFQSIKQNLEKLNYSTESKNILEQNSLVLVSPGQWKPFVKASNIDLTAWITKTDHEKDAMSLLWYILRVTTKKEIKYV